MKYFSFLLIITLFLGPVKASALPTNFGGQILAFYPCTCSMNFIYYIRDVRYQYMPLVYQPGFTILHKMYTPYPSVNTVGNYVPGTGVCSTYIYPSCVTIPSIGSILNFGTSLLP